LLYKGTIPELISDAETSLVRNWFLFSGALISAADTNLMAGWFRFAGKGKLIESHRAIAVSTASILLSILAARVKSPVEGVRHTAQVLSATTNIVPLLPLRQ
jgi:hypothetical protein